MPDQINPPPNSVQYNDWRQVDVAPLDAFTPALPVSVIIPYYQTPAPTLARTLAALERQDYPRELFEVIIVDDGSEPPLTRPSAGPPDLKVARQERRGFGLARARNTGARAAAHDILLFLDSDTLPEADWVSAHARWHHALSDVLTLGSRAYVSMDGIDAETIRRRPGSLRELFADRPAHPSPLEGHLIRTKNLTSRADDPFRVTLGGNFGMSKSFYRLLGGHNETFIRWGMEEIELGYRAYTRGGLLAPVRDAFVWHQGCPDDADKKAKEQSLRLQRAKVAHLIAHPGIRGSRPGRIFAVPQYVVTINARRCPTDQILNAVMNILADREYDLVMRIESDAGDGDDERRVWLQEMFGPDPRVRVAANGSALDEFPASPFHITLPAAGFARGLVRRLRGRLGDAVTASASLSDGSTVAITRAWALHRARRTGKSPADFGEARTIPAGVLKQRRAAEPRGRAAAEPVGYPSEWERLRHRMRDIRSPAEAHAFLQWLGGVARRRARARGRASLNIS